MRDEMNHRLQTMLTDGETGVGDARINLERDKLLARRPTATSDAISTTSDQFLTEEVDDELLRVIEAELMGGVEDAIGNMPLASEETNTQNYTSTHEVDQAVLRAVEAELLGGLADFDSDEERDREDLDFHLEELVREEPTEDVKRSAQIDAAKWYRLAVERDYVPVQERSGVLYNDSDGPPQDNADATRWRQLATEQGVPSAQVNLGLMYAKGNGVPQDFALAHMWFNLAAAAGDADAISNRDFVAERMSAEQITEAQRLAREWMPKSTRQNGDRFF